MRPLTLPITQRMDSGPVPWTMYVLAVGIALYLLIRPFTKTWILTAGLGILGGAEIAVGLFALVNATKAFGEALPTFVLFWAMATFAMIGLAIVNLWRSRWWRKLIASIGMLVFVMFGAIGINAAYGLNSTVAAFFGIVIENPIVVPTPTPAEDGAEQADYSTWEPPADMPATGRVGTQVIPTSGFQARPAGLYLPPAALVPNGPRLPLLIFMMGFPGNPDPTDIAQILDQFSAENKGLAPVVVVADQIGTTGDPACADSATFGPAETYITKDVLSWARANLPVVTDPEHTIIGGYSNGGGCAAKYGAQYPDEWKYILNLSGEEFPGSEDVDSGIATIYGGDTAAFEASKPITIMKGTATGAYAGMTMVGTVGSADPPFQEAVQRVIATAKSVGMDAVYYEIPGAGHGGTDALDGGLTESFTVLYPLLGLSSTSQ